MSFIAALATIGTTIAEGAALAGSTLAAGAGAIGSGIGSLGAALGEGAAAIGEGIAGLAGEGAAAGAEGTALGAEGATAAVTPEVGVGGSGFTAANNTAMSNFLGANISGGTSGTTAMPGFGTGASQGAAMITPQSAGGSLQALGGGAGFAAPESAVAAPTTQAASTLSAAGSSSPVVASDLGWAQQAVQGLGINPMSTSGKIASEALKQGVYGAGIGGLGGALTHPTDPMGGALQGAGLGLVTGGMGGAAAGGLGTMAGEAGTLGSIGKFAANNPGITGAAVSLPASMALSNLTASTPELPTKPQQKSQFSWGGPKYTYDPSTYTPNTPSWSIYRPQYYAAGGITDLDGYMSQAQNTPTSGVAQIPNPAEVADPEGYGQESMRMMAQGGVADLGGYRSGGSPNLLQGPGDGVSDDLKATIADRQPARLASGEYIVPSRIVSELGNGSTDAGAKRLDMMVQKVNAGRAKTLGGKKYAKDTKAYKHLPA